MHVIGLVAPLHLHIIISTLSLLLSYVTAQFSSYSDYSLYRIAYKAQICSTM